MRKVLLTVMMVSSLLAFNACKKDGAVGPAGPAGATGAAGAAGTVGPAGAAGVKGDAGAPGSKIYAGIVDPTTTNPTGSNAGDYFFNTATKTLWGPKSATTAWVGTDVTLVGAKGDKGDAGVKGDKGDKGTQFLADTYDPTPLAPSNAVTGDYYFNKSTGVFFGPKLADGSWANTMPLGTAYAAKTWNINRGFQNVTQLTKNFGDSVAVTYSKFDKITTYTINADDASRIANYPADSKGQGGWSVNREMLVETTLGTGVYDRIVTYADLIDATGNVGPEARVTAGRSFMYSNNTVNKTVTFNLSAIDVARLTDAAGSAFGYLTYAKVTTGDSNAGNSYLPANQNELTPGKTLNFATKKNVNIVPATTGTSFNATYSAETKFNLNTLVPNYEKYRQDGKIWVKYKEYTPNTTVAATNNQLVIHGGNTQGWVDMTSWANSYVLGTGGYGNLGTNPFTSANFMSSGNVLGTVGVNVPVGPGVNNVAQAILAGTSFGNGEIAINWRINSGTNISLTPTAIDYGPTSILTGTSTGVGSRGVLVSRTVPVAGTNTLPFVITTPKGQAPISFLQYNDFYSTGSNTLTSNKVFTGNSLNVIDVGTGKDAAFFAATNLVKVQVLALPGDVVNSLRAKGVNVDDINEVAKHIKL